MSKSGKEKSREGDQLKPGKEISGKSRKKGKTAKEMMNQHIINKNDVITDEDFKNLIIDVDITSDTAHQPLEISDKGERPKDEDKDPVVTTPWDVIS